MREMLPVGGGGEMATAGVEHQRQHQQHLAMIAIQQQQQQQQQQRSKSSSFSIAAIMGHVSPENDSPPSRSSSVVQSPPHSPSLDGK